MTPGAETPIDPTDWSARAAEFLLPYLQDPLLWPVTFSFFAHASVVLAPLFLHIARGFAPASLGVVGLLGLGTFRLVQAERRTNGRMGTLTWVLVATWLLGVFLAWVADRYGVY